jgi:hypothetical protein
VANTGIYKHSQLLRTPYTHRSFEEIRNGSTSFSMIWGVGLKRCQCSSKCRERTENKLADAITEYLFSELHTLPERVSLLLQGVLMVTITSILGN